MHTKGVFPAQKKNGTIYYRSSFTYRNKHISLGSFSLEKEASLCYRDARRIVSTKLRIADYHEHRFTIPFEKYVSLVNFRDNGVYFRNPIYLQKRYFEYYLTGREVYKFDIDDLFFYAEHKIFCRGNHLFVNDYGMQINLLSRYGIKSHAVIGRDYRFMNADPCDFRYENLEIINPYVGVLRQNQNGTISYKAVILIRGNYVIGTFPTPELAAIAYNKAADHLSRRTDRKYRQNYIEQLSARQYAEEYSKIKLPDSILNYTA